MLKKVVMFKNLHALKSKSPKDIPVSGRNVHIDSRVLGAWLSCLSGRCLALGILDKTDSFQVVDYSKTTVLENYSSRKLTATVPLSGV